MYNESNLSNGLVAQKDTIMRAMRDHQYLRAIRLLSFAAPVWDVTDYSYKTTEVIAQIEAEITRYRNSVGNTEYAEELEFELSAVKTSRTI